MARKKRGSSRKRAPAPLQPKVVWSAEKYRDWVRGNSDDGMDSLRDVFKGFDSRNGFNLREYKDWDRAQKAKIRSAVIRVNRLRAQPKVIVKPPEKKNLRKLQDSFHGDIASDDMKVAFVPYHKPHVGLPGAKVRKPKITYLKRGIRIGNGIYDRTFIDFDQKKLARDAAKEIRRAAAEMPDASLFYVAANENITLNGKSLSILIPEVLRWMEQYDGVRAIPKGSGNYGDKPEKHHWKIWLNGLIGYHVPQRADRVKLQRMISEGRKANQDLKRKRKNAMRRKGRR